MSFFKQAFGKKFDKLSPQLKHRFDIEGNKKCSAILKGRYNSTVVPSAFWKVFFAIPYFSKIRLPYTDTESPFEIVNQVNSPSKEHSINRSFLMKNPTQLPAILYIKDGIFYCKEIIDERFNVDFKLDVDVDEQGKVIMASSRQVLIWNEKRYTLPSFMSFKLSFVEQYDAVVEKYRFEAEARHPIFGKLIEFSGLFSVSFT